MPTYPSYITKKRVNVIVEIKSKFYIIDKCKKKYIAQVFTFSMNKKQLLFNNYHSELCSYSLYYTDKHCCGDSCRFFLNFYIPLIISKHIPIVCEYRERINSIIEYT